MNQTIEPGPLNRETTRPEPRRTPLGNLLKVLAEIYQEAGLPPHYARQAAWADLKEAGYPTLRNGV